jgi:hypothetical protein
VVLLGGLSVVYVMHVSRMHLCWAAFLYCCLCVGLLGFTPCERYSLLLVGSLVVTLLPASLLVSAQSVVLLVWRLQQAINV